MLAMATVAGSTMVTHPCDTRWGSRARMLESLVKNRECVEVTLSKLRREKFDDATFRAMSWIWLSTVWEDWEYLSRITTHMSSYVGLMQSQTATLGWSLSKYIELRGHLEQVKADLTAAQQQKLEKILEKRDAQFFTDWACAANVLDPRTRGQCLGMPRLRRTLAFLTDEAWQVFCTGPAPPVEEFMAFRDLSGPYALDGSWDVTTIAPDRFWDLYCVQGRSFSCCY